jgi:hypothetical protein
LLYGCIRGNGARFRGLIRRHGLFAAAGLKREYKPEEPSVVERSFRPVVPEADMGSFDYVRLPPHFAQDDRFEKARTFEKRDASG